MGGTLPNPTKAVGVSPRRSVDTLVKQGNRPASTFAREKGMYEF